MDLGYLCCVVDLLVLVMFLLLRVRVLSRVFAVVVSVAFKV